METAVPWEWLLHATPLGPQRTQELMLAAVNINLVAFGAFRNNAIGQVFALFVLTIAAAEVGVGLAIVLLIYRNLHSADLDDVETMKG